MPLTESQRNRRAEGAMMRKYKTPGLCFEADSKRQVVHVAIHDGDGVGTSITFDAEKYRELIRKLLGVGIDSIASMRACINHAHDLQEALGAVQVLLTPKATHCHRIITNALDAAKKGGL